MTDRNDLLFEVECFHFHKKIRVTESYWNKIITQKHPSMRKGMNDVILAIQQPDEIRQSKSSEDVYLFYRTVGQLYICVAVKILNGDGFIVTAYTTTKIKEGMLLWKK